MPAINRLTPKGRTPSAPARTVVANMAPRAMKAPAKDRKGHEARHVQPRLLDTDRLGLQGDFCRKQGIDATIGMAVPPLMPVLPSLAVDQSSHCSS